MGGSRLGQSLSPIGPKLTVSIGKPEMRWKRVMRAVRPSFLLNRLLAQQCEGWGAGYLARRHYLSIEELGAHRERRGASASPWGKLHLFPPAFITSPLGGHVFIHKGKERFPIYKLSGPAILAEMVKAKSNAAFELTVATELPARLVVEVDAILAGRAPSG